MAERNSGFQDSQLVERRKGSVTHEDLERGRQIMAAHIDERFDQLVSLIKSGFPNGDPESHRRVHEGYIQEAADRAALWKSLREKTITGVVWGLLVLLGTVLWEWFKAEVRK